MVFTLPELPYKHDALEPYIDEKTMHLHHEGHHQAYVNNLNKALENYPVWQEKSLYDLLEHLDDLPADIQTAVRNNAGGNYNHTLLWKTFTPPKDFKDPQIFEVGQAIINQWGSFERFQADFNSAAAARFGSGFAWLIVDDNKKLQIISTPNQDNPIMLNQFPLFGMDVWEHAYYLKYNNRRPEYIQACWNILNWEYINERYLTSQK